MSRSLLLGAIVVCALALLAPTTAAAAGGAPLTYDQAVDKLVATGYPQSIESYLNSLGAGPLGMREAGTDAEHAASDYLAAQLRSAGLKNVRLEAVPVDAYELSGADVTVGGRVMTASQFPGIPGTPQNGITGNVVYVHDGTAQDFDAAGDVRGKIVLVDLALDYFWLNMPGAEATARGATAVVATYGPHSFAWYSVAPDALGSNDGEYMDAYVPLVYVARSDGDWLKAQLASGQPVTATMHSNVKVTPYTKGGTGYNVLAEIPGSVADGTKVLVASHQDAHFRAGVDDTGAVATEMLMAKAMAMSGYKPKRTIVFLFTSAEEFGRSNSVYDYLIGSWYAISHTHTDWPGKVVGMINLECLAKDGVLSINTTPDLGPWLQSAAAANKALLPWGATVETPNSSWNDSWPLLASGVPGFTMAAGGTDFWNLYHTPYDTQEAIDWAYVGKIAKFGNVLEKQLDGGLLPYDLQSRANDLAMTVVPGDLQNAGVPASRITRLTSAVTAFRNAANGYQARKASISSKRFATVNASLTSIIKDIDGNLTALDVWGTTIYPHQQVLSDVLGLNKTLACLTVPQAQPAAALGALGNVGPTVLVPYFSDSVYADSMMRVQPGYAQLNWGALGHLAPAPNLAPEYHMIENGYYADAVVGHTAVRDADVIELGKRVDAMSVLLESLAPRVDALR